jgi:hypothetical protein
VSVLVSGVDSLLSSTLPLRRFGMEARVGIEPSPRRAVSRAKIRHWAWSLEMPSSRKARGPPDSRTGSGSSSDGQIFDAGEI